jgi:hypothetical protein
LDLGLGGGFQNFREPFQMVAAELKFFDERFEVGDVGAEVLGNFLGVHDDEIK